MHYVIAEPFKDRKAQIAQIVEQFTTTGTLFVKGRRNTIKTFALGQITANVKAFRIPGFVNTVAYRFFRKSKARRSFEYASLLLEKGIGTPQPIAYFENYSPLGLKDSYYVSEHLVPNLTFRELVEQPNWPGHENILRQFTQFCYLLHQKGVEFKDHSPGNTLIIDKGNGTYAFFLVDLNRMAFHDMDFEARMENLKRLTPKEEMVRVMSNEYAKLYGRAEDEVFNLLWGKTSEFQRKFWRKKAIKKKLKFWK
jgi:Lipopolysaccharide kinase (Kdo/WaaP) family